MNFSAGEDFYMYVNEKWLNDPKNKIPDEYSSWGGFVKLLDDGLKKQINIVKNILMIYTITIHIIKMKIIILYLLMI